MKLCIALLIILSLSVIQSAETKIACCCIDCFGDKCVKPLSLCSYCPPSRFCVKPSNSSKRSLFLLRDPSKGDV